MSDENSGPLWGRMNAQPRTSASSLTRPDVPTRPGVYCWYAGGEPMYSGRALGGEGLRGRVWRNHMATGPDLSRSSFRRNVCEHLGIATTSVTAQRPTAMTPEQVAPVAEWIRGCQVAWIEFDSEQEASEFEKALHAEWLPPLSRR